MTAPAPVPSGSTTSLVDGTAVLQAATLAGAETTIEPGLSPQTAVGLPPPELERRLIELGFVEGATVELLHQGLFGGDPIAVRVAATTIALRRREAMAVMVTDQS